MVFRLIAIHLVIQLLIFGSIAAVAKRNAQESFSSISRDVDVYNSCMKEELSQLQLIAAACSATNASGGTQFDQDCIRRAETSVNKKANSTCRARANTAAKLEADETANQDEEPRAPFGADDADASGCRGPRCRKAATSNASAVAVEMGAVSVGSGLSSGRPQRRPRTLGASGDGSPGVTNRPATSTTQTRAAAAQSAQNRVVQQPEVATADASADIQLCESSYSTASRCCGNPNSCVNYLSAADQRTYYQLASTLSGSAPSGQALNDYCAQMQSVGSTGSDVNVSLAGVCNSQQSACTSVCQQLAQKYQSLISSCNGCASQSVYQDAYQRLAARQSSCSGLARRVDQIASQAVGGSSAAAYANACQRQAGGGNLPIPLGTNPSRSSPNPIPSQNFTGSSIPTDPANTAASVANETPSAGGGANFAQTEDSGSLRPESFDVQPPSATDTSGFTLPANQVAAQAVTTGTVANNAGGAIPGGGGSSPARFGQASPRAAAGPGVSTDLLQGFQSAQGYSAPYVPEDQSSRAGSRHRYFGGTRDNSEGGDGGLLGMDLRQFLPGESRDPQRRIAGIGVRTEINAKEEDIWRRISNKIEEKCKLGILIGCR